MELQFTKMHGTGNDYVVLDGRQLDLNWSNVALQMCQRRFGAGADGLLVVANSETATIRMRMFNPDGSEAEMCGNGLRCFTKYVVESGIVSSNTDTFDIETATRIVSSTPSLSNGLVESAMINMGHPLFDADQIPILRSPVEANQGPILDDDLDVDGITLSLQYVSMGNPHAVCFIDTPVATFDLSRIGPQIEHHPKFPNRMNFHIANVTEDGSIVMRSWERGAGETWSCGSGACAVGVAASLKGQLDPAGKVKVPGGIVHIYWERDSGVFLEGPAQEVYRGKWLLPEN